jgi:hypothetical protein
MGLTNEETTMWIDQPLDHSTPPAIYLAVAPVAESTLTAKTAAVAAIPHKYGICRTGYTYVGISPATEAGSYYSAYMGGGDDFHDLKLTGVKTEVTVITQPKHGKIETFNEEYYQYNYIPRDGYTGKDQFEVKVKRGEQEVIILYLVKIFGEEESSIGYCSPSRWKISSTQDSSPTTITYSNLINSAVDAFKGFSDLPAGEVGNTTGSSTNAAITLDVNAAGYGWFIDQTPLSNDEFLPTAAM